MDAPLVGLEDASLADRNVIGGKAAALADLLSAGFRVPTGFVVTEAAIDQEGTIIDAPVLREWAVRTGARLFAVRSSGAAEDLPDASYAGLYATFLNVRADDLAGAVERCFASARTERVQGYRNQRTTVTRRQPMAALVQAMVDADSAGVAFTVNPFTGVDEVVVTAVTGLGEPLVGGETVGEEWAVGAERTERSRSHSPPVLVEGQATAVAALAALVAQRYGSPQDIEWAFQGDTLFLLQARNMTAVPSPTGWNPPGPGLWMRNFRLGEWIPDAMTPLFADWLVPVLERGYLDGMKATIGTVVPFRYASVNGWYFNAAPIPGPRLIARALIQSRGRIVKVLFNALVQVSRNPVRADRAILAALYWQWKDSHLPAYRKLIAALGPGARRADRQGLIATIDRVGLAAGQYLWFLAIVGGSAWKMESRLAKFCREHLGSEFEAELDGGVQILLRGLAGAEPSVPAHAVQSLDWYQPTVGELPPNPTLFSPTRQAELAEQRESAEVTCRRALAVQPKTLAQFDALLRVAQRYAVIREEQARDLTLGWPLLRDCVRRLGELMHADGIIANPDDVFFVIRQQLETTTSLAGEVEKQRTTWKRQTRLSPPLSLGRPPRLIGDLVARMVEDARGQRQIPEGAIVGQPASAGRATGRVRLISSPADFSDFKDGEVLLARATAPAWTPLFSRAAAVVTDGGTLAAHASLVAREYGIPAVVGTVDATRQLKTGQLVTVDGTSGYVFPLA
ncbi:PEP/pyruvate-binding domain-containing protein [Paenarthrobacter sp. PH39-S1]|uniref:PEP/pyruvate-binding domain-containing protein n=1 Tax=Paenarthrobacter sp. PH39-S1 TaxID=3046204 RepID=UPI0024B92C2A|nr:PEP/pyruvate-binding domain-containing protein [Paenarthrobacter sp. PH39-S1]MDJ0356589.1 PEP/pyruvate-binding domain-containing protein [Paenarthrobacter sp. PH39-S1]